MPQENHRRRPEWLKVRLPGGAGYSRVKGLVHEHKLNTVCEDARCPNIGECWGAGTATFMILGEVCTRACKFCAVKTGMPPEYRSGRTSPDCGGNPETGSEICRHHLGGPGRSRGRRRLHFCRDDPQDAGLLPGHSHRGADSRFPGEHRGSARRLSRPCRTFWATTSKRFRGFIRWRGQDRAINGPSIISQTPNPSASR